MAIEMLTQNEELYEYLKKHESITQLEALRNLGIMRLASRISDLRKMDIPIKKEMIPVIAKNGRIASVAKYSLLKEEGSRGNL